MTGPKYNITREQAIELYNSKFWEDQSSRNLAIFQMSVDRLCMPFNIFHKAIEEALGRPVFTHEFALNYAGLLDELMGNVKAPTFEEIINLIPKEQQILIVTQE